MLGAALWVAACGAGDVESGDGPSARADTNRDEAVRMWLSGAADFEEVVEASLNQALGLHGFDYLGLTDTGGIYVRETDDLVATIRIEYNPPQQARGFVASSFAEGSGDFLPPFMVTATLGVRYPAVDRLLDRDEIDYDISDRIGTAIGDGQDRWWVLTDDDSLPAAPNNIRGSDADGLAELFVEAISNEGLGWIGARSDPATALRDGLIRLPIITLEVAALVGDIERAALVLEQLSVDDLPANISDRAQRAASHLGLEA